MSICVLWFRCVLRLHDNPVLLEAIKRCKNGGTFYPIFIFDKETTTNIGYNQMKFLLESLKDLDEQLRQVNGRLFILQGSPVEIFQKILEEIGLTCICFEQNFEPLFQARDNSVRIFCRENTIQCIEKMTNTLWSSDKLIKLNGGTAPLTYQLFSQTIQIIGEPSRPCENPNWKFVNFGRETEIFIKKLKIFEKIPNPEYFKIYKKKSNSYIFWTGGERQALKKLLLKMKFERKKIYQTIPDLLSNESTSLSPYLKFGCLSIRRFYWSIHDLSVDLPVTEPLIWREYFHTMSFNNPFYDKISNNPICLNIPWNTDVKMLDKWRNGLTGFPLIDAAMRQLVTEGWIHHTLRNIVATFLTRGCLWLSWENGFKYFMKYLIDADWSVCAGNWMWISSSAFDKLLDSSKCTCPIILSKRLDPNGDYIRRYVPELKNIPTKYIHEPWNTPLLNQAISGCAMGVSYPDRMIDLSLAVKRNLMAMNVLRDQLNCGRSFEPPHCRPSNEDEIKKFYWLSK